MDSIDPKRGLAFALFGSATTAAFMVPWKAASTHAEPKLAVLAMLTFAAVFNSALAGSDALRGKPSPPNASWGVTVPLALAFAVLTLVGNRASAEAIARISGALLAVVQRCEVIIVAVVGSVVLREKVRPAFWLGTIVAGAGLWILERPGAGSEEFNPIGVLFGLASAACFGSMVLLARGFAGRVHLVPFNALRLWLSVGLWFAIEQRMVGRAELSQGLLVNAALAGFFGPFLSRLAILLSARHVPAHVTALASLATPIMTLALSFIVLGDLPTTRELLGGGTMLLGVAVPLCVITLRDRPSVRS